MGPLLVKDIDYVDDMTLVLDRDEDMVKAAEVIERFEGVSGAILNREQKCKVMGIGGWKERDRWPLEWLVGVREMRILGFQFVASWSEVIKRNWEELVGEVRKVLLAWSPRRLHTLRLRVEVVRIFVYSKIWYKAQILPVPGQVIVQIEKMVGRFLWMGRLERVALEVLCNGEESGGLGMVLLAAKADAMRLKHLCRLLAAPEGSSFLAHVRYWVGLRLKNSLPHVGVGPHPEVIPEYYKGLVELFLEGVGRWPEMGDVGFLGRVTTKEIYLDFAETPPPPAIEEKVVIPGHVGVDWGQVWARVASKVHDLSAKDVLFSMMHDVLPSRARLFRLEKVGDPFCLGPERRVGVEVEGPLGEGVMDRGEMVLVVDGTVEDGFHLFVGCGRVQECWEWIRSRIQTLLPGHGAGVSDWEMWRFLFPGGQWDDTVGWLLSQYVQYVWERRRVGVGRIAVVGLQKRVKQLAWEHRRARRVPLLPVDLGP